MNETSIGRAPASLKLALALVLVASVVALPAARILWSVAIVPVVVLVAIAARLSAGTLLRRTALALPFVLGTSLLALFQKNGLVAFGTIALRAIMAVTVVQVLTLTTPFPQILAVLRRARLPGVLVTTLGLLYRYLFVLSDESTRMRRARAARSFDTKRTRSWRLRASVIGQLFVRSTVRAERIEAAMRARGAT
jgi:cobalt/nickel transport system permease protein